MANNVEETTQIDSRLPNKLTNKLYNNRTNCLIHYIGCGTRALGPIEPLVTGAARSALLGDSVALCNYQYTANFPTKHNIWIPYSYLYYTLQYVSVDVGYTMYLTSS